MPMKLLKTNKILIDDKGIKSVYHYGLEIVIYLLSRVLSKSIPKTSYEMWKGVNPVLNHIHIWGCPTHVLKENMTKLESRTQMCVFLCYQLDSLVNRCQWFKSQWIDTKARPMGWK